MLYLFYALFIQYLARVCVDPDEVPCVLMKKCTSTLVKPLYINFNFSLEHRCFPHSWKSSYLFLISNPGVKKKSEEYGQCGPK